MIPVGLRYYFKREIATVADVEAEAEAVDDIPGGGDRILAEGPRVDPGKGKVGRLIELSDDESDLYSDEESDEDEDMDLDGNNSDLFDEMMDEDDLDSEGLAGDAEEANRAANDEEWEDEE